MLSQEHTTCMDMMSVLERQAARFKWLQQQQQQQQQQTKDTTHLSIMPNFQGFFTQVETGTSLPQYGGNQYLLLPSGFEFLAPPDNLVSHPSVEMDHCLSRTSSCHVAAASAAVPQEVEEDVMVVVMAEATGGRSMVDDSSNKRKTENEECRGKKKVKGEMEVESSRTRSEERNCSREMSTESTKEETQKKKGSSGVEKQDYIHVRARRGQATDSHSLAERARREKISRKMKCLQDLVPGCNKITGRAGMLDEIINYVQSLQRQVEFLSMKLAAVNPTLEFSSDKLSGKEFPAYASFPTAISSMFPGAASLAQLHQLAANRELENLTTANHSQISSSSPEKTQTSSAFNPELCLDSSCFPQVQVQPFWEADSQSFQDMGFHHHG